MSTLLHHYADKHGIEIDKDAIFHDYLLELERRNIAGDKSKTVGNGFCILCNKYVSKIAMHILQNHNEHLSMRKKNRAKQYGMSGGGVVNERSGFFDRFKIGINDKKKLLSI